MQFINQPKTKAKLAADKQQMQQEEWHPCLTIDGNYCAPKQRVGYCWSKLHRGYLTLQLMHKHECLQRQCSLLQKYEEHPYWRKKHKKQEQKKKKKSQQQAQSQKLAEILQIIRALTKDDNDFFAISIEPGQDLYRNQYIVRFVKFARIDIAYYVKLFKDRCGVSIYLQEIEQTHENKLQILKMQGLARLP